MSYEVSKCKLTLQCNSVEQHHTMISDDRCGQGSSSRPSSAVPLPTLERAPPTRASRRPRSLSTGSTTGASRSRITVPVPPPCPVHPSARPGRDRTHACCNQSAMSRLLAATWPASAAASRRRSQTFVWQRPSRPSTPPRPTPLPTALPPREGGRSTATIARHRARAHTRRRRAGPETSS
jgi:hypothetical protein